VEWAVVTVSDREIRLGQSVVAELDGWRARRARGSLIWGLYEALRNQELRGTTYGGPCWQESYERVLLVVDENAPAALVSQTAFTAFESGRRDVAFVVRGGVEAVPEAPVVVDRWALCGDVVELELLDGQVGSMRVDPAGGGRVSANGRWDEPMSPVAARAAVAAIAAPGDHPLDLRVALHESMTFKQLLQLVRPWLAEHAPLRWTWHPTYDASTVVPWPRASPKPASWRATDRISVLPFEWPSWGPCEDVEGEERRPGG